MSAVRGGGGAGDAITSPEGGMSNEQQGHRNEPIRANERQKFFKIRYTGFAQFTNHLQVATSWWHEPVDSIWLFAMFNHTVVSLHGCVCLGKLLIALFLWSYSNI